VPFRGAMAMGHGTACVHNCSPIRAQLYFDYVIRFRGNIAVTATTDEIRTAAAWVRPS
jgi:hypothetical protein